MWPAADKATAPLSACSAHKQSVTPVDGATYFQMCNPFIYYGIRPPLKVESASRQF